jgi:flagellar biosynthetic protein FliR
MQITVDPTWVSGFLLALVRATAWVFVCPPFGTRNVPTTIKLGLAAALTVALGPMVRELAVPLEAGPLLAAAALQAFAGIALGYIGILLFSAFQTAGSFIDLFGGLAAAQLFDPMSDSTNGVFGRFYQLLATVLLFAIDGHLLLVRGFLHSFDSSPLGGAGIDSLAGGLAEGLLAALFLADVALGLLSRAAPDLQVYLLGLPGKLLLTFSLIGITLPLLPDAVRGITDTIVRAGSSLFGG